jgi:hypothetical protein
MGVGQTCLLLTCPGVRKVIEAKVSFLQPKGPGLSQSMLAADRCTEVFIPPQCCVLYTFPRSLLFYKIIPIPSFPGNLSP